MLFSPAAFLSLPFSICSRPFFQQLGRKNFVVDPILHIIVQVSSFIVLTSTSVYRAALLLTLPIHFSFFSNFPFHFPFVVGRTVNSQEKRISIKLCTLLIRWVLCWWDLLWLFVFSKPILTLFALLFLGNNVGEGEASAAARDTAARTPPAVLPKPRTGSPQAGQPPPPTRTPSGCAA